MGYETRARSLGLSRSEFQSSQHMRGSGLDGRFLFAGPPTTLCAVDERSGGSMLEIEQQRCRRGLFSSRLLRMVQIVVGVQRRL